MDAVREREWVRRAGQLVQDNRHLARHETENTRWLLELLGKVGLATIAECDILNKATSWRTRSCRAKPVSQPIQRVQKLKDTGAVIHAWQCLPSDEDARALLLAVFRDFPDSGTFQLAKNKRVHVSDEQLALHATHLTFLLTDWLAAPKRWQDHVQHGVPPDATAKVLGYCQRALQVIEDNKCEEINAEIFIELAGCVGVLVSGKAAALSLGRAQAFALFGNSKAVLSIQNGQQYAKAAEDHWDGLVMKEQWNARARRHSCDVKLHCLLLRAWVCRLRPISNVR